MYPYIGSGPYCYTNSLAMLLGPDGPSTAVIETLTGLPFGFSMLGGRLPLFSPYAMEPELGLDAAITALGWTCRRTDGTDPGEALGRLRAAAESGPVLVGPVEMGLLLHQPGMTGPIEADHYIVVLCVDDGDDGQVVFHDPQGHPYATLPIKAFMASWRADEIGYIQRPFVLRHQLTKVRDVTVAAAVRSTLPAAARYLAGRDDLPTVPGSVGGGDAVELLAGLLADGLPADIRQMLVQFSVRVGARRLGDAASCLGYLGLDEAAAITGRQARLVGGLQYPLVTGDDNVAVELLHRLAPTYDELRVAIETAIS